MNMKFLRLAAMALPLLLVAIPATAAQADSQNASVTISDSGFSPALVNIPLGGSVTWTNQGSKTHTATTVPPEGGNQTITPAPFDSGGIGPGQTFTWTFIRGGTYIYSSYTDCLHNNATPGFTCGDYEVIVGATPPTTNPLAIPTPTIPAAPTVGPSSAPAGTLTVQSATVNISDTGITPVNIALTSGGTPATEASVKFVNTGTKMHTAVSGSVTMQAIKDPPEKFDTGGLVPGASATFAFIKPGVYAYNSEPDCLNGNSNPQFNCGAGYTITVVQAPVGANVAAVPPPFSGSVVYFRDPNGYDPSTLTIPAGTTVTWMNLGTKVHSVVSDSTSQPFNSGGMDVGDTFSVVFQNPGTYTYHSDVDPIFSGNQVTSYQYNGTVVVK